MQPQDSSPQAPGRLIPVGEGAYAFVPDPLPPAIDWTDGLVRRLSEADRALGELAGLMRTLPNPYLFLRPFMHREAVLSSRIEGTQASLLDLYAIEGQLPLPLPLPERREDAREVQNYIRALTYGRERLAEIPLSLRLLREMHEVLMEGVRGAGRAPGAFRRIQNWIGPPGAGLRDATFVPPPPGLMHEALDALERFLHTDHGLPPLVEIALVHYQFEAIHPFLDGNGRVGRLLITLMLLDRRLLPEPALYLSAYFERHRARYYDLLLAVSQQGAWAAWLAFFLDGVRTEALDAVAKAQGLLDLRQAWRTRYRQETSSANLMALLNLLFEQPVVSVNWVREQLGLTYAGAARLVERLHRDGLLEEITGRRRNRLFAAPALLNLLDA